ncbi:anti-sigma factor family protein [Bacillus kwashiorkori]|uniref:anti-sigma factor family protein n=1 Tax=Bacillus kwashiorkori TaxID=1522318 RepID=UPI000A8A3574|nr:anti-sigma factor [Bacillus kwashiorkori]
MNNCPERIIKHMHDFLDDDISPEHELELKGHLKDCEDCRKLFQEYQKTIALVKSTETLHAPLGFTQNIMKNLPKEQPKVSAKRWFRHHPFLTAAAVFTFLMLTSLFSTWSQESDFSVTKQDNIIIENNTAIVPEGETIKGDIVVKNGDIRIEGKVEGDVTVINGEKYLASAGDVTGNIEEINQAFDWLWYQIKTSVKKFITVIRGEDPS